LTLIELDEEPTLREMILSLDLDYIFIPNSITKVSAYGFFPKALGFNIGFLLAKETKWNLFHDIDQAVYSNFFTSLQVHLERNPIWLRCMEIWALRLNEYSREKLLEGLQAQRLIPMEEIPKTSRDESYFPGGSILVQHDIFKTVGGYDPEWFVISFYMKIIPFVGSLGGVQKIVSLERSCDCMARTNMPLIQI